MISFIVIGYNEGWKLENCINSIFDAIKENELTKYEIIYVDSNSTDDSIQRAQKFESVKIFKLQGDINAAIARNVGASESMGKVLFFIDGDMEIKSDFLKIVYSVNNGLIDDFVSGQWINYYYDYSDQLVSKEQPTSKIDRKEITTGGLFLIKKNKWELVSGMDNKFKKGQDHDLGLRLADNGIFLFRKKEVAAIHHTIAYLDKTRMWKDLFKCNHLYVRSLLYRKHVFNRFLYKGLLRRDYSVILLVLSLILLFVSTRIFAVSVLVYLVLLGFRAKFRLRYLVYYFVRDISVILGVLFFFPKRNNFAYFKV